MLLECCNPLLQAVLELPVLVVMDEAYIEFSEVASCMPWVAARHNLVVLRTFSKSAGAPPARVLQLSWP